MSFHKGYWSVKWSRLAVFFGALFFTLLIKVRCHNILPKWIHRKPLTWVVSGRQKRMSHWIQKLACLTQLYWAAVPLYFIHFQIYILLILVEWQKLSICIVFCVLNYLNFVFFSSIPKRLSKRSYITKVTKKSLKMASKLASSKRSKLTKDWTRQIFILLFVQ